MPPTNLPMQDQVRTKQTVRRTIPAWLGRNNKGFGQAGGGLGQNYSPANPNFQEPLSNTGVTDRRATDDLVMTKANMLPSGSGAVTPPPQAPKPTWLNPFARRPAAYGGTYNPTNMVVQPGVVNVPAWMGGDAETRDIPSIANGEVPPEDMPTYPISQTHPYGAIPQMTAPIITEQPTSPSYSFGTNYGGNWGSRRGGGGGYGGGGQSIPPWMYNMALNSWVFRG